MKRNIAAVKFTVRLPHGKPVGRNHGRQIGKMPGSEYIHIVLFPDILPTTTLKPRMFGKYFTAFHSS
jgi:hypothetical protein